MLVVWVVTGLVVLAVLGSVLVGVAGSLKRLGRELAALEEELEPLRAQVSATAARAAAVRGSADDGR
jgi:hypothetical protein